MRVVMDFPEHEGPEISVETNIDLSFGNSRYVGCLVSADTPK